MFARLSYLRSLAAGLGNLRHQTYTYVLQEAAKEVFASVGIDFIARNHGIRGIASAPESALCASAIYGQDFDSITWDFQIDKEKDTWNKAMYAHRAALASKNRPALIHRAIWYPPAVLEFLTTLEETGMPVLINDPQLEKLQLREIPDSLNMAESEVTSLLPPNLQYFRCGKGIERNHNKKGGKNTGQGNCSMYQFDNSQCP